MSGKQKARREAKARDRVARGKQRAQADLQRKWHLTLRQRHEVQSTYAKVAAELVAAGAVMDAQPLPSWRQVYEPHCEMAWTEQMAGADDMGGISNERNE